MPAALWVIAALVLWVLWARVARWIMDNPRGDFETGLTWRAAQVYVRVVHRLRVSGLEHIPDRPEPGPMVVVANHTAGVDPLLIQAACPFFIRWMMALDMRLPAAEWFWRWTEVISVDRDGREVAAARTAIRHLRDGGVVGIFPEGNLERPHRHILPFLPGVGLIIAKSGATVLPAIIDDTPQVDPAWSSLWRTSRSTVRFLAPVCYQGTGLGPAEIAADLRRRFVEASGWPACDTPDTNRHHKGK
ncbi:MAG: 1-acyl-sn-glycerol-3-phosphate acyltransferase [Phycisphaerales bacterium]|nr:1-acyl-sn-glycerol-3-phosphate acyltransferase [Phycisphaerales bacterium]